ncbi:MAG: hypothetical protein GKS06_19965 [Acidobacteria bacterium]|nr:hypothetical protein [Acidobacteriota bacterium]
MFEPLCAELWRDRVAAGRGAGPRVLFWGRIAGNFVGTLFLSWPRYFRDQGRFTRLGKATVLAAGAVTALFVAALVDWAIFVVRHDLF